MSFTHSIVIAHSEDFKKFLKSIRQIINESGSVYDNWEDSYEKSIIVISKQSPGTGEKIKEVYQANDLYDGLLETYYMMKPTITFTKLEVKNVNGLDQICLIFNSTEISNFKVDFANISGFKIDREENTFTHKDGKRIESIYPELCLLSTKHIKRKHGQLEELINISRDITRLINEKYGSKKIEFESEGFKYVPDNRKCKPIQLWH